MPKILRDQVGVKALNGLGIFSYRRTNTAGGVVTIETQLAGIIYEQGKEVDATATLVATIATSTTYPGTKTVAYTVGAGKTLECLIVGTNGYDDTATVSGAVTIDDNDIY